MIIDGESTGHRWFGIAAADWVAVMVPWTSASEEMAKANDPSRDAYRCNGELDEKSQCLGSIPL